MDHQKYLTEAKKRRAEIVRLCKTHTQQAVADMYGITRARVCKIVSDHKRKKT